MEASHSLGRLWTAIGKAYNMVDSGDSRKVEGDSGNVEWSVYRCGSGIIRVDVKKVN